MLAACAQNEPKVDEQSIAPLLDESYREAATSGSNIYRIVPGESVLLIHVGRDGPMKKLGHDHAVASEDMQGYIEISDDPSASRADIVLPLRNLVVDKQEHRQRLGLDTEPSTSDIAGTYSNMLRVFGPDFYPWVVIHALIVSEDAASTSLSLSITMNGRAADYIVPVELDISAARLRVSGRTSLKQSDFGLVPFQTAGGLLRVADALDIEFDVVAEPQRW